MIQFLFLLTDSSLVPTYKGIIRTTVPSFITAGIKTMGALALVLGIMFLFIWVLKKFKIAPGGINKDGIIRILGKSMLNPKQAIYLVEIPNAILILGVSGENINLLSEIKDTAIINSIKNNPSIKQNIFSNYIKQFITTHNPIKTEENKKISKKRYSGLWEY